MTFSRMQNHSVDNISFTSFQFNGFRSLGQWRTVLFIPYFFMVLWSITTNSILIYLIISHRTLHSPMYILIGLMAVVDLCWPMVVVPNMLLSLLFDWNQISLVACLTQMFCIQYFGAFQSTLLVWMALDRFFAICRPLNYHKYMEIRNFLKFIIMPIFRNLLIDFVVITLAGKLHFCSNEIDHCFCEHMALVQLACGDISVNNLVGLLGVFLIPTADFVLITASYVIIFASVMKSGRFNVKAINTCFTHIIVMTVDLTFALIAFLSYRIRNNFSSNSRTFLSTMYILFPGCFNPIIYGIRTKEIREEIVKFLKHMKVLLTKLIP